MAQAKTQSPSVDQAYAKAVAAKWMEMRQRSRTDLLYLCREVLQYRDIEPEVHGPIIDKLQKFKGGTDVWDNFGKVIYTPACDIWELEGPRERLFLDPRGHLKTTIISISHKIQWIINYYDIRILLSMATGDQVVKVMGEMLAHFRYNDVFRWLFPELCPGAKSAKEFGNNEGFTVPCRKRKWLKEPTVSSCSVGKIIAGGHYEVIDHGDLVDKENVKTPGGCREVIEHFRYCNPLLERGPIAPYRGWTDVEGTMYDDADLYNHIIDQQAKLPEADREWQISIRDAEVDSEKQITLWPRRFPWSELKRIEREMGPYTYCSQYRQKCIPQGSTLATREEIRFVPRRILLAYRPILHMTIDLNGMDPSSPGDFAVLNVSGFDRDGRMGVIDVRRGHFDPHTLIQMIFLLCCGEPGKKNALYPNIRDIKTEKDMAVKVLMPFVKREQEKRQQFLPPIISIARDSRISKKSRIRGLQPWLKAGLIEIAEEITCKAEVTMEITKFSDNSTYFDDFLDTLADQMQNREGGVISDVLPQARGYDPVGKLPFPNTQFLGFDQFGQHQWWGEATSTNQYYDRMTGL